MNCGKCKYHIGLTCGLVDYAQQHEPSTGLLDGVSEAVICVEVNDDQGLYAKLMTSDEFGCNQFEERK